MQRSPLPGSTLHRTFSLCVQKDLPTQELAGVRDLPHMHVTCILISEGILIGLRLCISRFETLISAENIAWKVNYYHRRTLQELTRC